jgi:large subunit ribosomal protein L2
MNFNKYKFTSKKLDVRLSKKFLMKKLKKLYRGGKKALGRSKGTIVMDHKGGGLKRTFRTLLTKTINDLQGFVIIRSIEQDPSRSSFIGVVQTPSGQFGSLVVNSIAKVGDVFFITKFSQRALFAGDIIKLKYLAKNVPFYNIEKIPGSGPVYARTAGSKAFLLAKFGNYAKLRLPSGEERLFSLDCMVNLGVPSNSFSFLNKKYKAGTNRLLNKRPVVRGTAKNPVDHPHGGGAGKTGPGRPSVSP